MTERTISVLRDQIADDPELYNGDTLEITDTGMDLIRTALLENTDPRGEDLITEVLGRAAQYARALEKSDLARQERDKAVKAAVHYGFNRTRVAKAAQISRERLYQIAGTD